MRARRTLVCEILYDFTYLVFFYTLLITALAVLANGEVSYLPAAGGMVAIFVANFFLRRISPVVSISFLIHLAVPVFCLIILPMVATTAIWFVVCMALVFFSALHRLKNELLAANSFMAVSIIFFIVLAIWTGVREYHDLRLLYPVALITIIVGQLILVRMLKMNKSLETTISTSGTPIKKILHFDYLSSIVLVVGVVLIIFVAYTFVVGPGLRFIADAIPAFPTLEPIEQPDMLVIFPDDRGEAGLPLDYMFPYRRNWIARMFGWLVVMMVALVAFVMIYVLGRIAAMTISHALMEKFSNRRDGFFDPNVLEDEKEFIFQKERPQKKRKYFAKTEEHPIRRQFRLTMEKHKKIGVPIKKSDTPTDIKNLIKTENINTLAEEYSHVRYGDNPTVVVKK